MNRKPKDRDDMTLGFKLWFAFCAALGLAVRLHLGRHRTGELGDKP